MISSNLYTSGLESGGILDLWILKSNQKMISIQNLVLLIPSTRESIKPSESLVAVVSD